MKGELDMRKLDKLWWFLNQYDSSKGGPFFLSPATAVDAKETVACEEMPGT
jgi:hypothetical protein